MKRLILLSLVFALTLMCSCGQSAEEKRLASIKTLGASGNVLVTELTIVVIDSCEYIQYRTYNGYYGITHKGNCKYCIENGKK